MPKDFARSFRALVGWYFRILGEVLSSLRFLKFPYPNQVSFSFKFGGHLLSHTVSSAVPSAVWVLTIVFGMGTGVSPARIDTGNVVLKTQQYVKPLLFFPRKEVIQPHLPIRLPCYDFTPVIGPTFGSSLLAVGSLTSGVTNSHGVTGGVYKTRERIHRDILIRDY